MQIITLLYIIKLVVVLITLITIVIVLIIYHGELRINQQNGGNI